VNELLTGKGQENLRIRGFVFLGFLFSPYKLAEIL